MKQTMFLCVIVLLLLSVKSYADETDPQTQPLDETLDTWGIETSLMYSSGDFGTSTDTRTLYWPTTIRRYFTKGDAGFTIPFIDQTATPGVAAIKGHPFRINRSNSGQKRSDTGLGDLLLDGHYHFFDESTEAFNLSGFGQLKFPTADEEKGLGTGEFDTTLGLESSKNLNELWSTYIDLYYTFIGEPPGTDLDDQFTFDGGVGYNLTEKTMATLFYREQTALVDDEDNARDVILGLNHMIDDATKIYGKSSFGLTDGSPDWTLIGGIAYLF